MYDETKEQWVIPELRHREGQIKERGMTNSSLHRPESEYARRRQKVDSNPRWHTQDIVELDIVMPERSTPADDDPNTPDKIAAILAMDLDAPLRELPSNKNKLVRREDKYLRVTDGKAKKPRSRKDHKRDGKSRRSSRPTTAM